MISSVARTQQPRRGVNPSMFSSKNSPTALPAATLGRGEPAHRNQPRWALLGIRVRAMQLLSVDWANSVQLNDLPPRLSRKAEEILSAFGGLKGLGMQPAWLISYVLGSFFPEDERKLISEYLRRRATGHMQDPSL